MSPVGSSVEQARRRYRPDEVRVLFVGESAPAGGSFFYFANSKLYWATRAAFERGSSDLIGRDFLRSFQALGCYLDDLCPEPVNRLPDRQRRNERHASEAALADRMKEAAPRIIVVVMSGIQENVRRALHAAGLGELPVFVLPFPSRPEHERRYIGELAEIVATLRQQHVFAGSPFARPVEPR